MFFSPKKKQGQLDVFRSQGAAGPSGSFSSPPAHLDWRPAGSWGGFNSKTFPLLIIFIKIFESHVITWPQQHTSQDEQKRCSLCSNPVVAQLTPAWKQGLSLHVASGT